MQIESRISSLLEYYAEMQLIFYKEMQIESRISSLLEYYAEMQLIFYKDNASPLPHKTF